MRSPRARNSWRFWRCGTSSSGDRPGRGRDCSHPDPAKRVTRYLEAVAEALRPASRAFRDDIANFRPATEIYEQNTLTAAQRVRELIDEGTRAGAFRRVRPPSSVKW